MKSFILNRARRLAAAITTCAFVASTTGLGCSSGPGDDTQAASPSASLAATVVPLDTAASVDIFLDPPGSDPTHVTGIAKLTAGDGSVLTSAIDASTSGYQVQTLQPGAYLVQVPGVAGNYQVEIMSDEAGQQVAAVTDPDGLTYTVSGHDARSLVSTQSSGIRLQLFGIDDATVGVILIGVFVVGAAAAAIKGMQSGDHSENLRTFERLCNQAKDAVAANCPRPACDTIGAVQVNASEVLDGQVKALAKRGWQVSGSGLGGINATDGLSCAYACLCHEAASAPGASTGSPRLPVPTPTPGAG
jgi:hypothetical protein